MSLERRVGVLLPSSNMVIEPEFYRTVPPGVTVHSMRLLLTEVRYNAWMTMNQEIEKGSEYLATAEVDVILFACTGASFAKPGYDREIMDRIRQATGIRSTTTSTAVLEAFKELKVKKISLATPYPREVNGIAKIFFESNGIEVIAEKGLGIVSSAEIGRLNSEAVYDLAVEADRPEAEVVLLSCTNLRTFDVLERLEKRLGKPVISSNQASLWSVLKILGAGLPLQGCGTLLVKV